MFHLLRIALCCVAIVYLCLCAALAFFQRSLIYFPQPRFNDNAGTLIALPVANARVLVSTRPKESARAIVYFGGNAEDVSLNLPGFSESFPDSALYLLHYRGYGGSSGKPSEQTLFADGLALFDLVHAKHSDVEVVGRSLGSGVAVYVASRRPVKRLVLVTPFDSLQEIAASQYPFVPVKWLLRDKFESWRYAQAVTAPILIIAAEKDEIIPRANTELLFSRFKTGQAKLKVIRGVGHNTISETAEYRRLLRGSP